MNDIMIPIHSSLLVDLIENYVLFVLPQSQYTIIIGHYIMFKVRGTRITLQV